jgi:diguanylate cyclase (GGDEF)-like protein/PAS domain S-box-containing protein
MTERDKQLYVNRPFPSPWILLLLGFAATTVLFIDVLQGSHHTLNGVNDSWWSVLRFCLLASLCIGFLSLFFKAVAYRNKEMEAAVNERIAPFRENTKRLEDLVEERTRSLRMEAALLEAIVHSSFDGILAIDNEGKVIFDNQRTTELWKTPDHILQSRDAHLWADHIISMLKTPDSCEENIHNLLTNRSQRVRSEIELIDGTVLDSFSTPILGEDGSCYGRIWGFRDVTTQKNSVEALRRSETVLRSVVSASTVGIALISANHLVDWVNEGMTKITGYSSNELSGFDLTKLHATHEEFMRVAAIADQYLEKGQVARIDTQWVHKDGRIIDVLVGTAMLDPKEPELGMVVTATNLSDRRRAEEELKESELRYRTAIENSNDGVVLMKDGKYSYVNQRWLDIFGYKTANEVIGKNGHLIVHPRDRKMVSRYLETRTSGNDAPSRYEFLGIKKDGTPIYVEASVSEIVQHTEKINFVFLRDISARREVEDALRENRLRLSDAMDIARIVYWEADPLTFKYVFNDAFYAFLGTTAVQEGGYEMSFDEYLKRFVHPDDVQILVNKSVESIRSNQTHMTLIEHRVITRDGNILHIATHTRNIKGNDGRTLRIIGVNQDITERKRAENALRESENKFRDLSEKSIVGIYLIQDGKFAYVNSRFAEIHGYEPDEIVDKVRTTELMVPENSSFFENIPSPDQLETLSHRGAFRLAFKIKTKSGEIRNAEVYGAGTLYRDKPAIIGTLLDVTERKQTEEALLWKTAFLEAQVNSSLDGILVIDPKGRTILQNQRTLDMWNIPRSIAEKPDKRRQFEHVVAMTKQPKKMEEIVHELYRHRDKVGRYEIELKNEVILDTYSCPVVGKDGQYYGRIWTFRDITELKHYWTMLENLSTTDGLTDLPNRRRFDEFLNREWRRALRDQSRISLILMDIDCFKEFNDHYGHLAGDDCLRQVALALSEVVKRPGDLVARYGGEEFACVLPDTDSKGAVAIAHKIQEILNQFNIAHEFSLATDHVTLSFGVATVVPDKGQQPSYLIELADRLMYSAKQEGRNRVKNWSQSSKGRRFNAK